MASTMSFAFSRPAARRSSRLRGEGPYAEQIHKVMRGYGDDQKELILKAYADLKLLDFFNAEGSDAAWPTKVKADGSARSFGIHSSARYA